METQTQPGSRIGDSLQEGFLEDVTLESELQQTHIGKICKVSDVYVFDNRLFMKKMRWGREGVPRPAMRPWGPSVCIFYLCSVGRIEGGLHRDLSDCAELPLFPPQHYQVLSGGRKPLPSQWGHERVGVSPQPLPREHPSFPWRLGAHKPSGWWGSA